MSDSVELNANERRLLVLAMGLLSLTELVLVVNDKETIKEIESQFQKSKKEYDELFATIDQASLSGKLS